MKIGDYVKKISEKPFKNGDSVQRIVSFSENSQDPKKRECAVFEDGSVCNTEMLKLVKKCPVCHGKGEAYFSCCTGEVVDEDVPMCPECHEHLGEEECEDCDGTGFVDEKTSLTESSPTHQLVAELRSQEQWN